MTVNKMTAKRRIISVLGLILAALTGVSLFWSCYQYDNKYTHRHPPMQQNTIILEDQWYRENQYFYLTDGWAFYQNKLLTPEEINDHTPDHYFYIENYNGYDLDDSKVNPLGPGTYRTVIKTDAPEQEYGLEFISLYTRWQVWINNKLEQSMGIGDDSLAPPADVITFRAVETIEIIILVAGDCHFYSGMVYPPALGMPKIVTQVADVRLLIHSSICAVALFIGMLCFGVGVHGHYSRSYGALSALCLCVSGSSAWPLFQVFMPGNHVLLLLERICHYGIFLSVIWIQGQVCRLPKKAFYPLCVDGLLVCLSNLCRPYFAGSAAAPFAAWSFFLLSYKWFVGLWLLVSGGWTVYKNIRYSIPTLAGNIIFATAIVMDRFLPLYEPIYTGWFTELAGAVLLVITAALAAYDMLVVEKERATLLADQQLIQYQLEARTYYADSHQDYVKKAREQLHENRNRFALMKYYLDTGHKAELAEYLDQLIAPVGSLGVRDYTGHSLIDAILGVWLSRAIQTGVYTEVQADPVPTGLTLSDNDLTSLLMNLLNNAIEACERMDPTDERWISVTIECRDEDLVILCSNSFNPAEHAVSGTVKNDHQIHGYGQKIINEIVDAVDGSFTAGPEADSYTVQLYLPGVIRPASASI